MYNGQDTFPSAPRLVHQNKAIASNWGRPTRNSYSHYKQQKNCGMIFQHPSETNQIFCNKQLNNYNLKRTPINYCSGRDQMNTTALYENQFTRNYRQSYIDPVRRSKIYQSTQPNRVNKNSLNFFQQKGNPNLQSEGLHYQKYNCQYPRRLGHINSCAIRKRPQIQSSICDRELQYVTLNDNNCNRKRQQVNLVKQHLNNTNNEQKNNQSDLLRSYLEKYNRYIKNQDIQQVIKCSQDPNYELNHSVQESFREPQLSYQNNRQKYNYNYEQKALPDDNQLLQYHDKCYNSANSYTELHPQNQNQLLLQYATNIPNDINHNKFNRSPYNHSNAKKTNKYLYPEYPQHYQQKPTTPSKFNKSSAPTTTQKHNQQLFTNRKQQLISKSKILRQKVNQLSDEPYIINIKNEIPSHNLFQQEFCSDRINQSNNNQKQYNFLYNHANNFDHQIKAHHANFFEDKNNKQNDRQLRSVPKFIEPHQTQKQTCNKLPISPKHSQKPYNLSVPQQRPLFSTHDNDSMRRINALNSKINEKINSIILAYGR